MTEQQHHRNRHERTEDSRYPKAAPIIMHGTMRYKAKGTSWPVIGVQKCRHLPERELGSNDGWYAEDAVIEGAGMFYPDDMFEFIEDTVNERSEYENGVR